MSTNYYWRHNICSCCRRYDEVHIGHQASLSWSFEGHFRRQPPFPITSWAEWKAVLSVNAGEVWDECGQQVPVDQFIAQVESAAPEHRRRQYDTYQLSEVSKKVDADTVLRMERDEMLDTIIGSHWGNTRRRGPGLESMAAAGHRYLIARNADNEGFYLVWNGPNANTNLTEDVYEAIADEAEEAGLEKTYHVYARLYVFQTDNVIFYQIPDRILSDFGLNMSSEPFHEGDA